MQYYWSSTSSTDPTLGANWTRADGATGVAPGNGDDVYIAALPGVALASIASADMSAVTLATLTISQTFTGTIGAAASAGTFGYWKIGASAWTVGAPSADGTVFGGSGRIKIDFGAAPFVGLVLATGLSIDPGQEPLRIKGTSSANKLFVLAGRVGVATSLPGETAALAELDASGGSAIVDLGPGVAWQAANAAAGATLTLASGTSGVLSVASGASALTSGTGAIALVQAGGSLTLSHRPASGPAVTTLNLFSTGVADFSQNPAAVLVSTLNHYAGGTILANPANPSHLTVASRNLVNCGSLTAA